jgi:hypothetical protein
MDTSHAETLTEYRALMLDWFEKSGDEDSAAFAM